MTESPELIDQAESLYDTLLPLMQADAPDVYGRKVKAQAAIVEALALRTPSDAAGADITDELEREAHALSVEGEKRGADDAEMFDATAMLLVKASVIIKSLRRRTPSDGEVVALANDLRSLAKPSDLSTPDIHTVAADMLVSLARPQGMEVTDEMVERAKIALSKTGKGTHHSPRIIRQILEAALTGKE